MFHCQSAMNSPNFTIHEFEIFFKVFSWLFCPVVCRHIHFKGVRVRACVHTCVCHVCVIQVVVNV